MIEYGHGNLLTSDAEALVNTVNTVGVMGKGIALQFKRAFPANYRAYREACMRGEVRVGEMFLFDTSTLGPRRYVVNFPTKRHWREPSHLEDIESGLAALVETLVRHDIASVAVPALGCGNGGLDWADVSSLIHAAFARIPAVRAIVFPPEGPPAPADMPTATERPRLTRARALLLLAMDRYLSRARCQEVREGISELEVQKLAYLLQLLGAPLRLRFARGHYGPYAEDLTHVLEALEGHYVVGFGDRSVPVTQFAPINLNTGVAEAAEGALSGRSDDAARLDRLLDLVDGFETPYSLELLATVHFAAVQDPPTPDAAAIADRVAAWSLRKARLFTDRHVSIAHTRLAHFGLLPG